MRAFKSGLGTIELLLDGPLRVVGPAAEFGALALGDRGEASHELRQPAAPPAEHFGSQRLERVRAVDGRRARRHLLNEGL